MWDCYFTPGQLALYELWTEETKNFVDVWNCHYVPKMRVSAEELILSFKTFPEWYLKTYGKTWFYKHYFERGKG